MLISNIENPTELMTIALQAEREAIRRYTGLATRMREGKNKSAARLFDRMVDEERQHEKLLLKWMASEGVEEDESIAPLKWTDPQVATTYNDEACHSSHSTPYRALAFAVHNEEIAFRFYTHVAAHSHNETVRQHAEILAREELGHAALLRAERRKAFHEEQQNHTQEPRLNASAINNEIDLLAAAIHIDRYLLEQMQDIKNSTPEIDTLLKYSQDEIEKNTAALNDEKKDHQLVPGEEITNNLEKLKQYNIYMLQKFDQPGQEMSRLLACCDRSFAFYDSIVDNADDEKVMLLAQQLTSVALDRIGFLKKITSNNEH